MQYELAKQIFIRSLLSANPGRHFHGKQHRQKQKNKQKNQTKHNKNKQHHLKPPMYGICCPPLRMCT